MGAQTGPITGASDLAKQIKQGMSKEQLRQNLLEKQIALEKEMKRLRRKRDLAASASASTAPAASPREDADDVDYVEALNGTRDCDGAVQQAARVPSPALSTHGDGGSSKRP